MTEPINSKEPIGELSIRTIAMPGDTNPAGHIFGGWVLSQMDMAGAIHAGSLTRTRVVTIAVDSMKFHKPIHIGDEVSCYTSVERTGKTSLSIHIETWVRRERHGSPLMVTAGHFTYVSIDEDGAPAVIEPDLKEG
ncbi:MAG: acyl-CoA thioesterase [Rhodospirillaceae bacterium]|nr:acyl-CoA thioesterase [Rhodospirillaceae bacterium]